MEICSSDRHKAATKLIIPILGVTELTKSSTSLKIEHHRAILMHDKMSAVRQETMLGSPELGGVVLLAVGSQSQLLVTCVCFIGTGVSHLSCLTVVFH